MCLHSVGLCTEWRHINSDFNVADNVCRGVAVATVDGSMVQHFYNYQKISVPKKY